ncbi:Pre-rRNA-processing protein PNO1 [Phlyctema vagabunda]|uniref:Pre-rRNA-processing protein PNO1 n=1 Tax=Phlyctema vagabunda TaxID=108571 RepID=A0ABR4PKR9_9HELO
MPAPTALLRRPDELAEASNVPLPTDNQDDELLLDAPEPTPSDSNAVQQVGDTDTEMHIDEEGRPRFAPAKNTGSVVRVEGRKVAIPPHRLTPLKASWPKIYPPLVEHLKLQVRMNMARKVVELRTSKYTSDPGALQKGEDFVKA